MASAFIALAVLVSVVAVGGVAQTDTENSTASGGDAEPNDSMANATPIEYGAEIDANLSSPSDVDYYAVNATAGDAIIPRLHLKNAVNEGAIQVDLVAPSGEVTTELTNDLMSGPQNNAGNATLSGDDLAYTGNVVEFNGTYYIRVQEVTNLPYGEPQTNESDTYRYNLTVDQRTLTEHEPNENGTTATALELDETANDTFAGYDSDVYAVNLTAGQNYTVAIEQTGVHSVPKTIWVYANQSQPVDDPPWQYAEDNRSPYDFDPNGPTVATGDTGHTGTGTVTFTASEDGTHYVQLVQGPQNYDLLGHNVEGDLIGPTSYAITVNRTSSPSSTPTQTTTATPTTTTTATSTPEQTTTATATATATVTAEPTSTTTATPEQTTTTSTPEQTTTDTATQTPTDTPSQTPVDTDGDGLTDEEEAEIETDPSDTDTDGDGWSDLSEVNRGCDPLDADSY